MNQGLMKIEGGGIAEQRSLNLVRGLEDVMTIAKVAAESKMFKDATEMSKAAVKIMAGVEIGIPPFAALRGFHVIEGKVEISAALLGSLIKKSGRYDFRTAEASDTRCAIDWYQDGVHIGTSSYSMEDARRAGLADKANWKKDPSSMLFARALTRGQRRYCPDVALGSVYAPGEITETIGEPEEKNITRSYPDIKAVETKPVKTAAEEIADIKADLRKGLPPDWTDAEFEAAWQKKGYHRYANPAALRAKIEEGRQKVAVKVEEPAEVETAPLVEVADADPVTGLTFAQATERAELTIKIEDLISKLDTAVGPEKSGKIVLAHSGGESYEDFDLDQLQKFYAALSEDVGTL